MKNLIYLVLGSLIIVGISCRKQELIQHSTAFTQGLYFYDYKINGKTYENYKTLKVYLHDAYSLKEAYFSGQDNYEIPPDENEFSYFWGYNNELYILSEGCLFATYPSSCSGWGFSLSSNYYIYIPNYASGLNKVDLYGCEGKIYGAHKITSYDINFTINGINYTTYRMEFYYEYDSKNPKMIGYFDANIGLIQLEKYDAETEQLISVLTFNHTE